MCGFWFVCYVCGLLSVEFMALFMVFNLRLVRILNLLVNFKLLVPIFLLLPLDKICSQVHILKTNVCIYFQSEHISFNTYSSSTTCFSHFCSTLGTFFNNMHGKSYRGGGLQFKVNIPKHTSFGYYDLNRSQNLCNYCT